ncbi:GntR family transcriptional regulator [Pseudomonas sp. 09C 129]|uniref:GntR family transcriptional regulator n=1 Tax=Pseudomonas TaxID=286 RepID=UPI000BC90F11|nr:MULTISPECIES: GntR family transcriptional regulator [unclassified Pseudomonas]AUF99577.1 GntR family transcriptional regulator [Pseudomonas sp. 09C 129]PXX76736.1 DNA-binding GntR family transcriptional regulator [Pseudomonas sp. LAMO17WK12:I9]SNY03833.1 transcriptional regulator, GntR family [Pseudomonas sp. LAMO17WK12:I10]
MTEKPRPLSKIAVSGPIPAHLARSVIEETLRAAILDGRLPSGTALRQQDLADLFGVSRMPVREALRQLEAQSLLHVVPHKGAVVAELIGYDAVETYGLRLLLELEALRLSIPLLDAEDIAQARGYIAQLENETDHAEIGRLNRLFHMALYHRAPNQKLLRLIELELNEEERFLRFHLSSMGLGKLTQDDHNAMTDAAEAKDVERAVEVLRGHLEKAAKTIRDYLERTAEG